MNIKPLYKSDRKILVGLDDDFREVCVPDGLVMVIDLERKKILRPPWSGQRILMTEDFAPIMMHQKSEYRKRIKKAFRKRTIAEIEKQLKNPPDEAVESLLWKPERLTQ
ncbi:MAG: hypothetical protein ACQETA_04960 [Bacteroidota bacterium]